LTARKLRFPVLADAYAFGVVAVGPERRGAGGADPFLAALMAAFLLGEPLTQGLEKLFEAARRLDLLLVLLGQIFLGELFKPFGWYFRGVRLLDQVETLEDVTEHAIELVEIALVLHQRRARQVVEILDTPAGKVALHRFHEHEVFAQRHRQAGLFELMEEGRKHCSILRAAGPPLPRA